MLGSHKVSSYRPEHNHIHLLLYNTSGADAIGIIGIGNIKGIAQHNRFQLSAVPGETMNVTPIQGVAYLVVGYVDMTTTSRKHLWLSYTS